MISIAPSGLGFLQSLIHSAVLQFIRSSHVVRLLEFSLFKAVIPEQNKSPKYIGSRWSRNILTISRLLEGRPVDLLERERRWIVIENCLSSLILPTKQFSITSVVYEFIESSISASCTVLILITITTQIQFLFSQFHFLPKIQLSPHSFWYLLKIL